MIYTVTLNPSLDYIMYPKSVVLGETNRSESEKIFVGGKGINVSVILSRLGVKSTALGFVAGFVGDSILSELSEKGVDADFLRLPKGNSRINVKLKGECETEINGNGPEISNSDMQELCKRLELLQREDYLVLAGSIPKSLPRDTYEKILAPLCDKGIRFVVDACGDLLLNVLKYRPFLVKPNKSELSELFGARINSDEDIIFYAERLRQMGALNVLVSLGADGSLLVSEDGSIYRMKGIKGKAINTVGAGDSMVAGFISGYSETGDFGYALKLGTACATASAFSEDLATSEKICEILSVL